VCCALEEATSAVYLCRVVLRDSCGAQITPQLVRRLMGVETENTKKIQKFLQMLKMRKFRREELDIHEFFFSFARR
jgi:hypothetical protein